MIDEKGIQAGVLDTQEAFRMAQEKNLDIVIVNPVADPPVCKILNLGHFQYEQKKKEQKQKSQNKRREVKALRISFKIGKHDLEMKMRQTGKFLIQGHQVKIEMVLRGREKAHLPIAKEIFNGIIKNFEQNNRVIQSFTKQGGRLSIILGQK